MRVGLALGEWSPPGVGVLFPTPGEPGQALFVPVVVVDVGAVEAVDDGGGVVEGFGRLEDDEGNAGANPLLHWLAHALLCRLCRVRLVVHHRRLTSARLRHLCRLHVLTLSFFLVWVAEQDTAGMPTRARASSYPSTNHLNRLSQPLGSRPNHGGSSPLRVPATNQYPTQAQRMHATETAFMSLRAPGTCN